MSTTIKGETVLRYLGEHPKMPSLTLARLIFDSEPEVFDNVEQTRNLIRYYRDESGKVNAKKVKDTRFVKIWQEAKFHAPVPRVERHDPYVMPTVNDKILYLSDVHIPYHDQDAIQAAVTWGKEHKVNTIILAGDILDCYEYSSFEKDPREIDPWGNVADAYEWMGWLRSEFPRAKIYFITGNHEYRIERRFKAKNPELFSAIGYSLNDVTKFADFDVQYIDWMQLIKVGDLHIGHGHELGKGSSAVNPARMFFLKAKASYIGGHLHRTSEHAGRGLGNITECYSVGCLCGLSPKYAPYNEWNHGFAYIRHDGNEVKVFNAKIENGRVK